MELTREILEKRIAMVRGQGAKAEAVLEQVRGAEMILLELLAELETPEPEMEAKVTELHEVAGE